MANIAEDIMKNSSRSTQDSLCILRREQLIQTDRKQLPSALTKKKKRKEDSERTPSMMACRQLMLATTKIVKVQVEVACRELRRRDRKRGTKKRPPPRPNPLKTPAKKPIRNIILLFSAKRSFFSKSSYPRVSEEEVQKSREALLYRQNQRAIMKMPAYSIQYSGEHLVMPMREGSFYEPLSREKKKQAATSHASCLKILILISSSRGFILVSFMMPLCLPFSLQISSSSVSLSCALLNLRQILGREQQVTERMISTMTALGSHLFSSTPTRLPRNIRGRTTKAYWYRIMGSLLKAVRIWLAMFPQEEPMMLAKTTMVASLGSSPKKMMRMTTLAPPPPSPARLDSPAMIPMRKQPRIRQSRMWSDQGVERSETQWPRESRTSPGSSHGRSIYLQYSVRPQEERGNGMDIGNHIIRKLQNTFVAYLSSLKGCD